jgi:hypothetical protein
MATEAYCVKCKAKREMNDATKITMKNWQAGDPGQLSGLRHEDVQDRRLTRL